MSDEKRFDWTNPECALGIGAAVVFGIFFLFFATGMAFDPELRKAGMGTWIGLTLLVLFLGGSTVAGIAVATGRSWGDRLQSILGSGFAVGLQFILLRGLFFDEQPHDVLHVTTRILAVVWVVFGLMMYVGARFQHSYFECALWPLLFLLVGRSIAILISAVIIGLIAGAAAIGARLEHPYVGGVIGLAMCIVPVLLLPRERDETLSR